MAQQHLPLPPDPAMARAGLTVRNAREPGPQLARHRSEHGLGVRHRHAADQMDAAQTRHAPTASSAWARSAMMSSMCSMPIDNLTYPGFTPFAACSASESCECVVLAGWIARLRASPILATW